MVLKPLAGKSCKLEHNSRKMSQKVWSLTSLVVNDIQNREQYRI
jgi:hypothetical protein